MTIDNVVQMPDTLARCAKRAKHGLARMTEGEQIHIDGALETAMALFEARGQFGGDDRRFGAWCRENGFGDDVLSKDDRAALIAMGECPETMREVLAATNSRSIQVIWRANKTIFRSATKDHNRFASASKTTGQRGRNPPKRAPGEEQHQRSINLSPVDWEAINKLAEKEHVSTASKIGQLIRGQLDGTGQIELPKTAQAKLEIAKRQIRRELEAEHAARMKGFDEEVRLAMLKRNEAYLADLNELENKARIDKEFYERMINNYKAIFSLDEFRAIVMCLHPDSAHSRTPAKLNAAFMLFNAKKLQLTKQR